MTAAIFNAMWKNCFLNIFCITMIRVTRSIPCDHSPPAAASLISLRGADAAVVNQWASAPAVNRERTDRLWTALAKGAACATALHAMRAVGASAGDAAAAASAAAASESQPRNFEVFNAVCYGLPSVAIADK